MTTEEPKLLDTRTVAKMLGVPKSTVYDWAGRGVLPSHKLGRLVRFDRADVLAFIRARRREKEGD